MKWQRRLGVAAIVLGVMLTYGSFHHGEPRAIFTIVILAVLAGDLVAVWLLYRHLVASGEVIVRRDRRSFCRMVIARVFFVVICFGAASLFPDLHPWLYIAAGAVAFVQIGSAAQDFHRIEG